MVDTLLSVIVLSFVFIDLISTTMYTCDPTLSCGCSALSTVVTSRIVGGEAASNYTWGWMVSFQQFGSHICGASLITSEYAITAAHCLDDVSDPLDTLSILVGTNYLDDESSSTIQRRSISKITIHPNYNSSDYTNDIAILQFSPFITSSDSKLTFICLPNENRDLFETNTDLVAIGWGYTSEDGDTVSNYLQQVTVQAFSSTSTTCLIAGIANSNVQFCAGVVGGGKDTCQGDSGGPLMAFVNNSWILAGITSFGTGCARADFPGIYTRVSSFITFINSNTIPTVSEDTTVPVATSTYASTISSYPTGTTTATILIISSSTQSSNKANIMDQSISILMFQFSFLVLFQLSY